MKSGAIKEFSAADLHAMRAAGESRSDFAALRSMTEVDLERGIAGDDQFQDVPRDWHLSAKAVLPRSKKLLSLRLDDDVVAWFKDQGPGYQTRINAVLRAFVAHRAGKNQA